MLDKPKLFRRITALILFLFFLNAGSIYFHWYSSLWWLDMVAHFLGGAWLGLFFLWMFYKGEITSRLITEVILVVFAIGFIWEAYEAVVNEEFARNVFDYMDTISDIFFDLSGGAASILYFSTRIMRIP